MGHQGRFVWYELESNDQDAASRFYTELIRSRNLSRTLSRIYRLDLKKLETRFFEELR